MEQQGFPARRRTLPPGRSVASSRLHARSRGAAFDPPPLPNGLSAGEAAGLRTIPVLLPAIPNTQPSGQRLSLHHGLRAPTRSSRFVLRRAGPSSGGDAAELHAMVRGSDPTRAAATPERERVNSELDEMIRILTEVEAAGPDLQHLPRQRLARIQQVLRRGVQAPGGAGYLLPPMPGSRPDSAVGLAVGMLASDGRRADQSVGYPTLPRGLSESEIGLLNSTIASPGGSRPAGRAEDDEDVCAVCLCEMAQGETLCTLACRHAFHHACISRWLRLSVACPLCKAHALGKAGAEPS